LHTVVAVNVHLCPTSRKPTPCYLGFIVIDETKHFISCEFCNKRFHAHPARARARLLGICGKGISICAVAASTNDQHLLAVLDEARAIEVVKQGKSPCASATSSNSVAEAFMNVLHEDVSASVLTVPVPLIIMQSCF
jgi:hypothetical protein